MKRVEAAAPASESSRWQRVSAIAYQALVVPVMIIAGAILTAAVAAVCLTWVVLPFQLSPGGPTCSYQDDPGSGSSGVGIEHIEWGLFPERVCAASGAARKRTYSGDEVHSISTSLSFWFLQAGLIVSAGVAGGALVRSKTSPRRRWRAR